MHRGQRGNISPGQLKLELQLHEEVNHSTIPKTTKFSARLCNSGGV
ncbi:hypothetical protein CY0110_32450 [Crocosphaera chwakensis CCY0110]|uniref:Uncharacterized protein n=2 Tax=Crocosphaera TaxID=263510 RepID=A3IS78_9CHRO|nr:hypothetical protein CY0110_32450 [Crocosphaera chwakensis CCY0110]